MLVFSRRALQAKLDLLVGMLTPEKHSRLVKRLNRPGRDQLAAMWEVVVLQALSATVPIRHEATLCNGRQPDLAFSLEIAGRTREIVGDITTASDAGLDKLNPISKLGSEISRLARKYGLDPNHFRYEVEGESTGTYAKRRTALLLPTGAAFEELIGKVVDPYIKGMTENPPRTDQLIHKAEGIHIRIRHDTSQWASSAGYPCYDLPLSLTENPLFRALRGKADQLRHAPSDALRLVILCDAGCAAMRCSAFGNVYSAHQIAKDFLRQNSSVDLVLLATVEQKNPYATQLRDYKATYDLVVAPATSRSPRVDNDAIASVKALLESAVRHVPIPMADACNAANRSDQKGYGLGKHGGYEIYSDHIRLSKRLLHELLAGKVTMEEFVTFHRWNDPDQSNPFVWSLSQGELITGASIVDCGDEDDDWIEFRFGPPDPAVSPFVSKAARKPANANERT